VLAALRGPAAGLVALGALAAQAGEAEAAAHDANR